MKRRKIRNLIFSDASFKDSSEGEGDFIFRGLNFEFTKSSPVILQGPAVSGKRVLLKLLLGLFPLESGEYFINEESVGGMSFREFDPYRLNMGFSFESGGHLNNRTLFENLTLPLLYHDVVSKQEVSSYVEEFLHHFGIMEFRHLRPAFVGPEVRKVVNLIRAFLLHPELVVLDDPTEGTGVEYQEKLIELIEIHQKNRDLKYIVAVSDDERFIKNIDGKVYLVHKSELVPDFRREAL
jgi:ABC-type transporter Mla maintaining outer membrane lipid asymmetry ATPase subunit MlaF